MIKPFVPEELLEIGNYEIVSFQNDILIVDNWYKNYDIFHDVLTNMSVPRWKWDENGRNFIDYYDCRLMMGIAYPDEKKINFFYNTLFNLIYHHYGKLNLTLSKSSQLIEFNFFKHIKKDVSNNFQHYPHTDTYFNCLVYMDKVCSGGTAIYKNFGNQSNDEQINLLFDVSKYEKDMIQSKPNRLVIFPGTIPHGGYIEDHNKYVDDWRINQVIFIESE